MFHMCSFLFNLNYGNYYGQKNIPNYYSKFNLFSFSHNFVPCKKWLEERMKSCLRN